MCVAQFRDYCGAMSHKLPEDKTSNDLLQPREPYEGINGELFVYADNKKMRVLANSGNVYAKQFMEEL